MIQSYRFQVFGRVQGVGYRDATRRCARRLLLDGWVRNCIDGSVEGIVTSKDAKALLTFRNWLDRGPPSARVDRVTWQAEAIAAQDSGFSVLR